ncbi:MAG TPA: IPT/TIG domain-containing protein, partial [Verrucomicrobiae bacterium]|nr:IPT/TIG domain-containing protein [Verrucomicrobiae bacterium]
DTWTVAPPLVGAPSGPAITGIVNAAGGNAVLAPNTFVSILGTNLAPAGDSRPWSSSDFLVGMPAMLDGVTVTVNGTRAYVNYISPMQINILTPPDLATGPATVQVTVNGSASAPFRITAQASDPAFFRWGNYAVATHADYTLAGPASLFPGQSTPVRPGEAIILWANGFGATSTPVINGAPVQSGTLTTLPVIRIGGQTAVVAFAGLVSDGLYQINVTVPQGTPAGDQTIVATYNGGATQSGLLINVSN